MAQTKVIRTPVRFRSGANMLYGVVHQPPKLDNTKLPMVMLSAGLKNRTGYARLYVRLADRFASEGHTVIRFDYHGCGDSDGRLNPTGAYEEMHADINEQLSIGIHADDALAAIDKLKEVTGSSKVMLFGLCSGANASVYVGARSDAIKSMILLNMPVLVDSAISRKLKEGKINLFSQKIMYETYLKKIFSPRAWLRFFSFKSDFSSIWFLLKKNLFGKSGSSKDIPSIENEAEEGMVFNKEMLAEMEAYFNSGRKLYIYLSENDPIRTNFEEFLEKRHGADLLAKHKDKWERYMFKDANHAFVNDEWRNELFEKVLGCLQKEASR